MRQGMNPHEAKRSARIEVGGPEQLKEEVRAARTGRWLETFWQDIRFGARMLRKNPGFTAVAVLTLALGIGANAAMFSVVNAVLLRPLPYADSRRLVRVEERHADWPSPTITYATFLDIKNGAQSLTDIGAYRSWTFSLTGDGYPESIKGALVSAEYFSALRVQPIVGRFFAPEEDRPESAGVVVLGHSLWQRRYGSDPNVTGKIVTVNGTSSTVIGVMPAGFREPFQAEIWAPLVVTGELAPNRRSHLLTVIARLRPGVDVAGASAEMELLAQRISRDNSNVDPGLHIGVASLHDRAAAPVRPLLTILLGAVGCLLLIACTNLASLVLARGIRRSREFAIRAALGAGRARLAQQAITESILLATFGAGVGLLIARWCLPALQHWTLKSVSGFQDVKLDWRVIAFTAGVALLTGMVCSLAPVLEIVRHDAQPTLNESNRGATGLRHRRLRDVFVVSEVAIALVLMIAAGLLLESFGALLRVPLGVETNGRLTMELFLSPARYNEGDPRASLYLEQVRQRLEVIPGVKSVGIVDSLPLEGGASTDLEIFGRPAPSPGQEPSADIHMASPGYFETMGIPLVAGRYFTQRDTPDSPRVMVISQMMARQLWPGENPIGQKVTMKDWGPPLTGTIVGVVGDVKLDGPEASTRMALYWPYTQFVSLFNCVVVQTDTPARAIVPAIQAAVWFVDHDQTIASIQTMDKILSDQLETRRFDLGLLGVFAGFAVLLSSVGIYGVLAHSVQQRTQEIGVRMALGAERWDVIKLVLSQGLATSFVGVAIGLAGALALTRLMSGLLFGISATDPFAFASASVLFMLVALVACSLPARRASQVDPMVALRNE